MIQVQGITYGFQGEGDVFADFSWEVEKGASWSVLGPSGCGKTTLLYLLAGLVHPPRGQVVIAGQPLSRPRPQTGLIIQEYGLLPWATVRENARLGLKIRGFYGPDGTHAPREALTAGDVDSWLERLGLEEQADKYPAQLSGGQRQRTAISRTLVLRPDLLLMDEPFSSLDAPTRESLQELTLELRAERDLTLVVVTHNIEEAAFMGEKILLLSNPPNRHPQVLANPGAGSAAYRGSKDYLRICTTLRERMEGENI